MIQLGWDDPQERILSYTFTDPWTWEDYYATSGRRDELFNTADDIVDIILDFRDGKRIPDKAMTHFRKAAGWDHPKRGIVVVVGVSGILQALANIMIKVYPQAATKAPRTAKDLNAAREMIKEARLKRNQNFLVS